MLVVQLISKQLAHRLAIRLAAGVQDKEEGQNKSNVVLTQGPEINAVLLQKYYKSNKPVLWEWLIHILFSWGTATREKKLFVLC